MHERRPSPRRGAVRACVLHLPTPQNQAHGVCRHRGGWVDRARPLWWGRRVAWVHRAMLRDSAHRGNGGGGARNADSSQNGLVERPRPRPSDGQPKVPPAGGLPSCRCTQNTDASEPKTVHAEHAALAGLSEPESTGRRGVGALLMLEGIEQALRSIAIAETVSARILQTRTARGHGDRPYGAYAAENRVNRAKQARMGGPSCPTHRQLPAAAPNVAPWRNVAKQAALQAWQALAGVACVNSTRCSGLRLAVNACRSNMCCWCWSQRQHGLHSRAA